MEQIVFVDTNVLMNPKFNFSDYNKVYISIVSIEELDKLKHNEKTNYQARQAIKKIKSAENVEFRFKTSLNSNIVFLEHNNDNLILSMFYDIHKSNSECDSECVFISDDYNLILKAKILGLPCEMFEFNELDKTLDKYNGWRIVRFNEKDLADFYEKEIKENKWGLNKNEYLLILDEQQEEIVDSWMWDGFKFQKVKIKPISNKYINKINPYDEYQKIFIHMLLVK